MAKQSTPTQTKALDADQIINAYVEYTLEEGKRPASVYKFCKELPIEEDQFYAIFGSFDALETRIWEEFLRQTFDALQADKAYASFGIREKVLAFYYTFIEVIRKKRSFLLFQLGDWDNPSKPPRYVGRSRRTFDDWISALVEDGKASGEIAKRPYADKRYPDVLWFHFLFIVQFWLRDDSPAMEQTDAAIEKSVNLAFEVIGKGVVEQTIDFGKFLYQHFKY